MPRWRRSPPASAPAAGRPAADLGSQPIGRSTRRCSRSVSPSRTAGRSCSTPARGHRRGAARRRRRGRHRGRTRISGGIPSVANGSPTPAIASTARSCHRPNTTRWRRAATTRPKCRRDAGHRRLREHVPDVRGNLTRSADAHRAHDRRAWRLRGRRVHAGCAGQPGEPPALADRGADRRLGRSLRRAGSAVGRAVRLPVREPGQGRRRDPAPPARADLRLPLRASAARPRAGAPGRAPRAAWPRPARRAGGRGGAGRGTPDLRRVRGRRVPACVRPLRLRGVDRAAPAGAVVPGPGAGRAARLRGRAEDRADEARRRLAGADALRARLPRRRPTEGRIRKRTCMPSCIRRGGCAAG
jgi:hypothetical protein